MAFNGHLANIEGELDFRSRLDAAAHEHNDQGKKRDIIVDTFLAPKATPDELRETLKVGHSIRSTIFAISVKFVARNEERISRNKSKTGMMIASTATGGSHVCQRKTALAARSLTDAVGGSTILTSCISDRTSA
jgi:hypothetical protein